MFENRGVLLPVWLLGRPLVVALVDCSMTPKPAERPVTGRPYRA